MAAVVDNVASTTTSTELIGHHDGRATLICNSDANDAYVLLGTGTASASNMSFIIETKHSVAVPDGYTGPIQIVWAADGSGYAHVTTF